MKVLGSGWDSKFKLHRHQGLVFRDAFNQRVHLPFILWVCGFDGFVGFEYR